jgi:hypothetical protein
MKIVAHPAQSPCRRPGALFGLAAAMSILPAVLAPAAAATVAIKDGNVVLTDNGQQRQLTRTGKNADPVLSPDGKWVAYTRVNNPGSTGSQGDCKSDAIADELRRTGTNGSGDELLVRGQDSSDPKSALCDFSHKQFTSDGRYIFFLSPAWAVSAALHRYDIRTKTHSFVIDANDVIVLNDCKRTENRDSLVVLQHRYFVVAGSYDWYWLFDAAGKKEKGPVGQYDNENAVRDAIKDSTLCNS